MNIQASKNTTHSEGCPFATVRQALEIIQNASSQILDGVNTLGSYANIILPEALKAETLDTHVEPVAGQIERLRSGVDLFSQSLEGADGVLSDHLDGYASASAQATGSITFRPTGDSIDDYMALAAEGAELAGDALAVFDNVLLTRVIATARADEKSHASITDDAGVSSSCEEDTSDQNEDSLPGKHEQQVQHLARLLASLKTWERQVSASLDDGTDWACRALPAIRDALPPRRSDAGSQNQSASP